MMFRWLVDRWRFRPKPDRPLSAEDALQDIGYPSLQARVAEGHVHLISATNIGEWVRPDLQLHPDFDAEALFQRLQACCQRGGGPVVTGPLGKVELVVRDETTLTLTILEAWR